MNHLLLLHIYVICAILTVIHSAYKTGQEQARLKKLQPTQFAVVNYANNVLMSIIWFAYWIAMYGRFTCRHELDYEAADGLGIPREMVRK